MLPQIIVISLTLFAVRWTAETRSSVHTVQYYCTLACELSLDRYFCATWSCWVSELTLWLICTSASVTQCFSHRIVTWLLEMRIQKWAHTDWVIITQMQILTVHKENVHYNKGYLLRSDKLLNYCNKIRNKRLQNQYVIVLQQFNSFQTGSYFFPLLSVCPSVCLEGWIMSQGKNPINLKEDPDDEADSGDGDYCSTLFNKAGKKGGFFLFFLAFLWIYQKLSYF